MVIKDINGSEEQHNKYVMKLLEKRKLFFSAIAIIAFVSIITYKIGPAFIKGSTNVSLNAKIKYENWANSSYEDIEKLEDLKKYIKKYPSLELEYKDLIRQNMIVKDSFSKNDEKMVSLSIENLKRKLPFYGIYSEATLLIQKKDYEKALELSIDLKNKMLKDLSFLKDETLPAGAVLYSFNLLRIATLYGKMQKFDNEIKSLQELEEYLSLRKEDNINRKLQKASDLIKRSFKENEIELADYISYKKKLLSSN